MGKEHTSQRAAGPRRVHPAPRPGERPFPAVGLAALTLLAIIVVSEARGAPASGPDAFTGVGAGSLFLAMGDAARPAPRLDTAVNVHASGALARVSMRQRFRNDSPDWVEAVYVFPLPGDAAVDCLHMHIGDRVIVGEIQEREAAKRRYAAARDSGRRAGLVEQERPNLFTTSVANVGPGETVEIEIGYLQTLRYDTGEFHLRIPMTMTPRFHPGEGAEDAPRVSPPFAPVDAAGPTTTLTVRIDAGLPLDWVNSRYHQVKTRWQGTHYEVELGDGVVPPDRDFELQWRPSTGAAPALGAVVEHHGGDHYALLMFLPPHEPKSLASPPREVVFVIDTSGSMGGASIRQARKALLLALDQLADVDRFNVIEFNSTTRSLFPGAVPATPRHVGEARRWVGRLRADGGTEMAGALRVALDDAAPAGFLRQVVFITDGSVGNESALFGQIQRDLGDSRLFTVGIGAAPNGHFMTKAAQFGRGTFTFVSDAYEVEEKMAVLFEKLSSPVMTDLRIHWPGGQSAEAWPARVPDLYLGEPVVVTARLPELSGIVTITGEVDGRAWVRQLVLDGSQPRPGVADLWARRKIAALMDRKALGGDPASIRSDVLNVALDHGLVSAYTSLVAVDATPARSAGLSLEKQAVPLAVPHGNTMGFPRTATAAPLHLLAGTLIALFGHLAVRSRRGAWS